MVKDQRYQLIYLKVKNGQYIQKSLELLTKLPDLRGLCLMSGKCFFRGIVINMEYYYHYKISNKKMEIGITVKSITIPEQSRTGHSS